MILAIDDDPTRYAYLAQLLHNRVPFHVATCRACVLTLLPEATAVLLDFDLDGREECARCKGWIDVWNSAEYLGAIVARRVPVIVSSCSRQQNRNYLTRNLEQAGGVYAALPADRAGREMEWVGQLWVWGVL